MAVAPDVMLVRVVEGTAELEATPIPSCPIVVIPQHLTAPLTTAQLWFVPAAIFVAPLAITSVGVYLF